MEVRHWIVRRVRRLAQRLLDATASSVAPTSTPLPTDAVAAWMEIVAAEAPTLVESESYDAVDPPTVAPARNPTGGASRPARSWIGRAFAALGPQRGWLAWGERSNRTSTGWRGPAHTAPGAGDEAPRAHGRLKRSPSRAASQPIEDRAAPARPRPAGPAAPARPRAAGPAAESAQPATRPHTPAPQTEPQTPWAARTVADVSPTPLRRLRFRPDDRSVPSHSSEEVEPAVRQVADGWFAPADAVEALQVPEWPFRSSDEPGPADGPWAHARPAATVAPSSPAGAVATRRGPVMLPVWPTLPPSPLDADDGGQLPGAVPVVGPFGSGFEARWASERSAD